MLNHGDVCEVRRHNPGKSRHNSFRDLLARQIRDQCFSTVSVEYAADAPQANPLLRGDLFVTGPAAPDGVSGVVDITFTAPSSSRNTARVSGLARQEDETYLSWSKRQLRKVTGVRESDKRRKYQGAFLNAFTPVVLTTGGYLSSTSKAWLKRLDVFTKGKLAVAFDLSVALIRARASALV